MIDKKEVFERFILENLFMKKLYAGRALPKNYEYLPYLHKKGYTFNSQLCSFCDETEKFIITQDKNYIKHLILDRIFMMQLTKFLVPKKHGHLHDDLFTTLRDHYFKVFMTIPDTPPCKIPDVLKPTYKNSELSIYGYYQHIFQDNIRQVIIASISGAFRPGHDITPTVYNGIQKDIPFLQRPFGLVEEIKGRFYLQSDPTKLQKALEVNLFQNIDMADTDLDELYCYLLNCKYKDICGE